MDFRVALNDTDVKNVKTVRGCRKPLYSDKFLRINQDCFYMKVPGVGSFYACDGRIVEYSTEEGADPQWVQLYLNNQVLVALLHQRKIISFHASSFVHDGRGVMILGETGAGKSSLTLSFALKEGGFMTDDLTPVVYDGLAPCIMPLHRKVKIRKDTAIQLGLDPELLIDAESGTGKKYLNLTSAQTDPYPVNVIMRIEPGPVSEPLFITPFPAERFALLRSEVCSWEILAGMPETEKVYLQQLAGIVEHTEFIKAVRPPAIELQEFYEAVRGVIEKHQARKA